MGTMLALDSPRVALIVFAPLVIALWLVALTSWSAPPPRGQRGRRNTTFPRWLLRSPLGA